MRKIIFSLATMIFLAFFFVLPSQHVSADKSNVQNPIALINKEVDSKILFEYAELYDIHISQMRMILIALEFNSELSIEEACSLSINQLTQLIQFEHQEEIAYKYLEKKGLLTKYIVTFVDYDGTVLKQEEVPEFTPATPPSDPFREGYLFAGWDRYLKSVESSMTVTAQYVSGIHYVIVDDSYAKITYYTGYMSEVRIPSSILGYPVKEISPGAFSDPEASNLLRKIYIPESVEVVGPFAFYVQSRMLIIFVSAETRPLGWDSRWCGYYDESIGNIIWGYMEVRDNGQFRYSISLDNTASILGFSTGFSFSNLILPSNLDGRTVIQVANLSFFRNLDIQSIWIPNSITKIGDLSFYQCSNLNEIQFEEESNLSIIGGNVFSSTKISSILIPNSVRIIGAGAFSNCTNLTTVLFEEDSVLEEIPVQFASRSSLHELIIPSSVTKVGNDAFMYCPNLTKVFIPNNVENIGAYAFFDSFNVVIYAESLYKPIGWDTYFNYPNLPVIWGATLEDYYLN